MKLSAVILLALTTTAIAAPANQVVVPPQPTSQGRAGKLIEDTAAGRVSPQQKPIFSACSNPDKQDQTRMQKCATEILMQDFWQVESAKAQMEAQMRLSITDAPTPAPAPAPSPTPTPTP